MPGTPVQTVPTTIVVEPHERAEQHRLVAEQHLAPGFDSQLVRIALPWRPPVLLLGVDGRITPPRADQLPRRRYLAYGSSITRGNTSITHGNTSIGPGDTYPARLGRMLGVDVLNLGFGGGAHLEPQLADYFAGRDDWDFATLELAVNLMGTLSVADFTARVEAFLPRLVAAAGERWIVCTDMFVSRFDLEQPAARTG